MYLTAPKDATAKHKLEALKTSILKAGSVKVWWTKIARILRILVQTGANLKVGRVTDIITYRRAARRAKRCNFLSA